MNGQPTRQYAAPPVTSAAAAALNRGVGTLPRVAEPQLDQIQALVAGRLLDRVDHHSGLEIRRLTDDELKSPAVVTTAAAQTMVTSSRTLPPESRPAAAGATANMLAERFDELPRLLDEWNARGLDVGEEARRYGAALGDETAAAVRGFERHAPDPSVIPPRGQSAAAAFTTDPAIPPLTKVRPNPTDTHRPTTQPRVAGKGPNTPSL
ncbi:hypothetical protein [Kribbella sp. NPDC048928]|uniref:hypothetical protein n=1 Tax=Kribbella sp. NPDC048928 TaxID=3364111 RepID=UPI0037153B86